MDPEDAPDTLAAAGPVSLVGRWIVLRPISQADHQTFFGWRVDLHELHLWSGPRRVPTWEEFRAEIEQITRQSTTFLVLSKETGEPIGFVRAYNLNAAEGWCFTAAYVTPRFRRRPHAAEAYMSLLEYLFSSFPVRKVYADVNEFNIHPMRPLMNGGFEEEGRLRQHTWYKDRYWDLIRLAMDREAWYRFRERTHFLLGVAAEAAEVLERQGPAPGDGAEAPG